MSTGSGPQTATAAAAAAARAGDSGTAPPSYPLWIDGKDAEGIGWVYSVSARSLLEDVFTSVKLKRELEADAASPAAHHDYVVGRCAVAGEPDIDLALEAAAAAAPRWASVPLDRRMQLGTLFREKLTDRRADLTRLLVAEGHPVRLARWQVDSVLRIYSEESLEMYRRGMRTETELLDRLLILHRQPDGVVCINPPQNTPATMAALSVLVLMAGNAVVLRAPRSVALSTMFLMRDLIAPLMGRVGAPEGALNIVCANPGRTLRQWVSSPLVDDIFFVGGTEEGLRFERECVAHGKKPILELSGNDGLVVWKDADLDHAAEAICESFYGSGQICMLPNYVLAHPDIAGPLIDRVATLAADIRPGFPEDETTLLSPVRRTERFFALLQQALDRGAKTVCGGKRTDLYGNPSDAGVFLQPTVVRVDGLSSALECDVVGQETFFPLLPIVVPQTAPDARLLDDFIAFVNHNDYGLRNSLWARSQEVTDAFIQRVVNGGLLKVNDSHIGVLPYLPSHGGTGFTSGVFGEANYPMFRTSHLQGVSIGRDLSPRREVFGGERPL